MSKLRKLLDLPARSESAGPTVRVRRHLSSEEVAELVARYESGETVYELASHFRIHRDRVSTLLRGHDVATRYHATVEVDLKRAAKLERAGLTMMAIAQELGIGRTTLVKARQKARQQ